MVSCTTGYLVERNDLLNSDNLNNHFQRDQDEALDQDHDADNEEPEQWEIQLSVTDTVTDNVGLEGSLEDNYPDELCNGSKVFLPNTKNCSLFYDCTNKEGSSCPHGMWFDPNYIGDTFCQFPEVICAADNDICDCAEKYPPLPPDPLIENSVSCLKDNRFHLFSSKVDCGRYFICHNEMKYRMECRQGLHYNSKTEMCDYPEVVNCRVSVTMQFLLNNKIQVHFPIQPLSLVHFYTKLIFLKQTKKLYRFLQMLLKMD